MKKAIPQFLLLVVLFVGSWVTLRQVDWVTVLGISKVKESTEDKIGKLTWELMSHTEHEVNSRGITRTIDSLVNFLCKYNRFDSSEIKIHILEKNEVNAFTLPGDYLVIYSGLLVAADNEGEVLGVIAHEIGHMQKKHVMKKLVKEMGLSVLVAMTTGNKGSATASQIAKLLSSSAYDRNLEREADRMAVDYMIRAGIDPEPFANFLFRMADDEKNIPEQAYWISTHPESRERAEFIINYIKGKTIKDTPVLSDGQWQKFKDRLDNI